jgi:transposase
MNLTSESLQELKQIQRNVSGVDYIKVTTILMLDQAISISVISASLGIDVSTVYRYAALDRSGGISALTQANYKGYWDLLSSQQISLLRTELKSRIYTNSKQVCAWIANAFGVVYTQSGIIDLLNRIGFTYKKTKEVPCECDAEKQQAFMEKLAELLSQRDENSVVYYADGVHPTHNSRSTWGWIEKGKEYNQPILSGRDRININGLLKAHNVTDVITHECERVNAQSTKEHYMAALEKHPQAKPI